MKLKQLLYTIPLAAAITAMSTGCNKSKFDINKNSNQPTDSTVTYDVVLPAAMHASGTIIAGNAGSTGVLGNWLSYTARSGTYAPNVIEETYEITTGFGNTVWNNCYDNNYDYQIVASKAAVAGAGFYEGIARIMKAHNFQLLVDVYGNVPYTQALKGSANPTPSYDNGLDIYKALLREIDAGITLIKAAVVTNTNANKNIATNDIMFGGNKTLWVKFANTLKLRMLIHAYAVAGINKAAEMTIINNEGTGFLGAGEDAQVQPGYKADRPNPFYNTFIANTAGAQTANNVYYRANEWGIDYYAFDGDPRQARFYAAGLNGMKGVTYGLPPITANASPNLAGFGPGLAKTNSSPQAILTASESFFLQAEARQRGIITSGATAASLLNSAIVESFRYIGVASPASAAATYQSNNATYPDVDINGAAQGPGGPVGGLFTILSQKWFALNYVNNFEVWTDFRRVPYTEVATNQLGTTAPNDAPNDRFVYGDGGGYTTYGPGPFISVSPQNVSTKIPVRFLYPQTEYNYNAANVGAQGNVTRYSRIFWDLN
ncbi:MAG: SusD/RagB family nutrient-binding outer membrane lipoprotein [Bacteroidetes bacterium]|nr:SusD/RagB family nutrient-binding outer membrane lipoprotein [Bacteroidota bacterium]